MDTTATFSSPDALTAFNQRLLEGILKPLQLEQTMPQAPELLQSLTAAMAQDKSRVAEVQQRYYRKELELWSSFANLAPGARSADIVKPPPGDRRFQAPEWQQPYFSFLVQSYLLRAEMLHELVQGVALEPHAKRKLEFLTRQCIDAAAPSNFAWSNPEALKLAAETRGESLAKGLRNLAADIERGMVSMTDESAFEVGVNLAVTPGAVIYENDFMQVIQYRPQTEEVYARPLVIVPPCINKYYILDLQPDNSFVSYAVQAGHTVFLVSWRNMPASLGHATWDDYLTHGVMRALDIAHEICGSDKVNALGFCVGGTLLGCALAVRRAQNDERVSSMTLLTSMLDFHDTGELSVFVDEAYVQKREGELGAGGVLPGRELAITFASLRANDLIWQYVVNNYLKGKTPPAFDLLYWNADSTNLPGAMYVYYVRNMYLENNLREPHKLTMCGVPVDARRINMPAYVLATREDHIVPWKTAYSSARLLKGKVEFVLAASGHIAGVVNPASRNRRHYWVGGRLVKDPERWLKAARTEPGSWWTHWSAWLARQAGRRVPARRVLGNARYSEIEPAPGRYVKEKAC
jgi:polyhydroxyalkanoate synthase subunit PhaC